MCNNVRRTQNKVSTLKMSRSILVQTKIKLVTLSLKLSLQKGCYKLHNMSSLFLYYTRRGKEAVSHPFSIPLFYYMVPLYQKVDTFSLVAV